MTHDGTDLRIGVPVVMQTPSTAGAIYSLTHAYPLPEPRKLEAGRLYMMGVDEAKGEGIIRDPDPEEAAAFGWMVARGVLTRPTQETDPE